MLDRDLANTVSLVKPIGRFLPICEEIVSDDNAFRFAWPLREFHGVSALSKMVGKRSVPVFRNI